MKNMLKAFWKDEDGAALVEYGVALLVVIVVGVGGLLTLSQQTEGNFQAAATSAASTGADPVE